MKKSSFVRLLFCILFSACNSTQIYHPSASIGKSFGFSDRNGNGYFVSSETFVYTPVKPGESSTGIYDGGTPVKNKPRPEKFQRLAGLMQAASTAIFDHMHNPESGSSSVLIRDGNKTVSFILKMGSTWQFQIEALLREMKTTGN